jgi:hypothetical protein
MAVVGLVNTPSSAAGTALADGSLATMRSLRRDAEAPGEKRTLKDRIFFLVEFAQPQSALQG